MFDLTMAKKINTELLIEAWEKERCLWDVCSVIYKNSYEKNKEQKEISKTVYHHPWPKTVLLQITLCLLELNQTYLSCFGCIILNESQNLIKSHHAVLCVETFCNPIRLSTLIPVLASYRSLDSFSSPAKVLATRIVFSFSNFNKY